VAVKKKKVVKRVRNNKAPPPIKIQEETKLDWIKKTVDSVLFRQQLLEQEISLIEKYREEIRDLKFHNSSLDRELENLKKEMISFLTAEQIEHAGISHLAPELYFLEWLRLCKKNELSFYNAPITISYTAIKDIR
jgi:predicted RNase H-like nuclease (RuvC/YqgF family)